MLPSRHVIEKVPLTTRVVGTLTAFAADPGRRVSLKRITWLLGVVLFLGCVALAILRLQSRLLGDPLTVLGRMIAPHYH